MRLIDRSNQGYEALQAAQAKLLELANNSKITGVYADSLPVLGSLFILTGRKQRLGCVLCCNQRYALHGNGVELHQ